MKTVLFQETTQPFKLEIMCIFQEETTWKMGFKVETILDCPNGHFIHIEYATGKT